MNPKVSVIIPAYNRASVLPRSIGSVLAQTFTDFEIIVADDASTDATREAVAALAKHDPRISLLTLETNGGAARARNAGVAAARGEYIAFLDSDDWWLPGKLAAQIEALSASAEPARTLCSHAYRVEDHLASRIWPRRGPRPGEALSDYMFVANGNLQTSTWLVSRALCLEYPFEPALRRHQDWDFLLRLADAGVAFLFLEQPLGHRVCAPAPDRLSDIADANYSREFLANRTRLFTPAARAAFGARTLAWQLYKCGERGEALGLVWQALRAKAVPLAESVKIALRLILPGFHALLVQFKERPSATGGVR